MSQLSKEELICRLFDIEAVKFGNFKLKSGIWSPFYVDLRVTVSYPELLSAVGEVMHQVLEQNDVKYDLICGVPYTALPIATCISTAHHCPMVMRRKEVKSYGTKQLIEGKYKQGQTCVVIEDIVSSGTSVLETVDALTAVGLQVSDVVVLIDREQGGRDNLNKQNLRLLSVFKITEALDILCSHSKVCLDVVKEVSQFVDTVKAPLVKTEACYFTYGKRASMTDQLVAKQLLTIMEAKKTNLCYAADVTTFDALFRLVNQVGPYICALKTHCDVIEDFNLTNITELQVLAHKYNFMLFEDRKFADIGHTVQLQYAEGVYSIVTWADLVTVHALPGPALIKALKGISRMDRACVIVAEMSSADNLCSKEYTASALKFAEEHKDFVIGFVSQSRLTSSAGFIHMTPGVQFENIGDPLGQQYTSPVSAVTDKGADIIIVGRGITQSADPAVAAQQYRDTAYSAYLKCLKQKDQ